MKSIIKALCLASCFALPLAAVPAHAATKASCTADAKAQGLKGKEKKAFMKSCMPPKKTSVQAERMKSCNAEFKGTGRPSSDRKAFMSQCLKK